MNRFAASTLAIALVAATGTASAQNRDYPVPANDRYTQAQAPYYDYARVLRVDPVLQSTYRPTRTSSNECYSEDGYYTDNGYDDRYDDRYSDRGHYGRDSDYDRDGRNNNGYGTETGRNVAAVLGGIVGAALGSKVGGGSARYATAAVGSMVGGMAGREIYENTQRNRQPKRTRVTVCDPISDGDNGRYQTASNEVTAYDVTYDYAGRQYTTRTNYHPGDRIRVRVDVRPE
jgi:uncharacterized protein YcfJ